MKKIFLGMMATLALFASCDPITDDVKWSGEKASAEQLEKGITIKQYGGDKAACNYTETELGNWVEFYTNPSKVVRVYYKKKDGSIQDLSTGKANGLFFLKPARGSEPQQTLYFETLEFDGSTVTVEKTINIEAAKALTPEQMILCSNKGEKIWKWDFDQMKHEGNGVCWGNMGADASWGGNDVASGGFTWWGVQDAADLSGQTKHAVAGDFKPGEADNDASMVFNEDGSVKCLDKDGNVIRQGSWDIKDWDPTFTNDAWKAGTLVTSEGATLFPYEINADGKFVTNFEIHKLTADKMLLVYPDKGKWSGWQEATYWCFKSDSDPEGVIAGDWTWDFNQMTHEGNGVCWGNMGSDASWGGNDIAAGGFTWWGVQDAAQLADQAGHVAGTPVAGEYDNDAYMSFDVEGNVACFDKDGNQIRTGTFEFVNWDPTFTADAWKAGILKTSEGATLFPYEINAKDSGGPRFVTEFEIHKLTPSQMLLVYPDKGKWSGWQEATYWCFKKK